MPLLIIPAGHCHLIARLLQSSHVFPFRPGLHARRSRARLERIRDKFEALLQEGADLWVAGSNQGD